ncbi:hypothetical protein FW778_01430 [Ginsengibacter hankyongi]|uniref:Uncharacterized protein n=1 Tax=Ginsengibacter hankyongi TaxID=2607284 RepID=A0A5J5II85_9BACT|nr:hypothetical protein [Ginsengibacter hankyongi]KAA9040730.1 hypothetical protein FW778_01430 [Ginsengibacter hankyongi]
MRYTLLFSILLIITSSCTKTKFSSTPSLKFKSVNTTQLPQHALLQFTLSFTDAEGDFSDSGNIFVQKISANCPNSNGDETYVLPVFPTTKDQKGEISVTLGNNAGSSYRDISPQCPPQNDTTVFRFVLKDDAGHISDTASSPTIIIYN